ncbi:MAG: NAD(P)/FAD-dependent oxidoreductase [Bacteroidia bacterium]|nr:NAD(P)/FAD-dependent oxidoreductase [Bacteroidia bacterium]
MHKVIVIGAGPVGLYLAKELKKANLSHLVLEASNKIGGQLTSLYPEKEIVDLPGIQSILAKDFITLLEKEVNMADFLFHAEVIAIHNFEDHVEVQTKDKVFRAEFVVIATGLGFYKPKPLGIEEGKEYSNIIFSIADYELLKNKNVAIFGGGDSALDWAKEISRHAKNLYLVHRRREFRGNFETIKDNKAINVLTPYIPYKLIVKNDALCGIIVKHVEDESTVELDVDYVLVNFGNIPAPVTFDVPKQNTGILCDEHRCVVNRIYVAGDAIGNPGKIKRIGDGLKDADSVLKTILKL